jgi:predicted RNA binding protein YcfA (HicA-like mRNA interferase family)
MKSFKQHLEERCWPGYKSVPGKKTYDKGSCQKEEVEVLDEMPGANMDTRAVHKHLRKHGWELTRSSGGHDVFTHPDAKHHIPVPRHKQLKAPLVRGILKQAKVNEEIELDEASAAWQRKEGKNPEGGLNRKGIESYRRENPGSKLSMAVTTPPSKLKPGSKAANRRKSFCARMGGMPGPMKDEKGRPTRKALSLRKWNC